MTDDLNTTGLFRVCGNCGEYQEEHAGAALQCLFAPTVFRDATLREYSDWLHARLTRLIAPVPPPGYRSSETVEVIWKVVT